MGCTDFPVTGCHGEVGNLSRGSRNPHPISVLSWCRQQATLCALTCALHIPMTHIDGTW